MADGKEERGQILVAKGWLGQWHQIGGVFTLAPLRAHQPAWLVVSYGNDADVPQCLRVCALAILVGGLAGSWWSQDSWNCDMRIAMEVASANVWKCARFRREKRPQCFLNRAWYRMRRLRLATCGDWSMPCQGMESEMGKNRSGVETFRWTRWKRVLDSNSKSPTLCSLDVRQYRRGVPHTISASTTFPRFTWHNWDLAPHGFSNL